MIYADFISFLEPKQSREAQEAKAQTLYHEGFDLLEQLGERWGFLKMLNRKRILAMSNGDSATQLNLAGELKIICQETDFEGIDIFTLATLAHDQGDFSRSLNLFQTHLESMRFDYRYLKIFSYYHMGECAEGLKQLELARNYFQQSMHLAQEIGQKGLFTGAIRNLVEICLSRGQYQQAGDYLQQGLVLVPEMDANILAFQCLFPLFNAAEGIASPEKMTRLLGYINQVIADQNITLVVMKPRYDQVVADLQSQLDPDVFQASLDAGRKLSVEQVQAEALAIARQVAETEKA
jgi:tetratricopeptide (TPR) repeat protein